MHPRLYLISPIDLDPDSFPRAVEAALSGGDVACLLIADGGWGEGAAQKIAERVVPIAQAAGTEISRPMTVEPSEIATEFQKWWK